MAFCSRKALVLYKSEFCGEFVDMQTSEKQKYIEMVSQNKKRLISFIKFTLIPVAIVFLLLAVALFVDLLGVGRKIKLEAGEPLPSAASVSGHKDARYTYDEDEIDVTKVGEYEIVITYGKSNTMKIKLQVVDTKAPVGTVKPLSLHLTAALPSAEDFFEEIYDASEYRAKFVKTPKIEEMGEYRLNIVLEDEHGNNKTYPAVLTVISDTEPPKIYAPSQIVGYVGEGIAYRTGVKVVDNCFGTTLEVDDSEVDPSREGEYFVRYIATDAAGNKAEAIVPVIIHKLRVSEQALNALIEDIAKKEGMTKNLSKEELCKLIYAYINDPKSSGDVARFKYVGFSNDKSRTDWRNEAYLTIKAGAGDCYSYFALAKAFFEYFGIENLDIERSKGLTSDTHFWNMVNIGTSSNPRWYFFDATRYAGKFELGGDNGCLLTAAQLEGYKASNSIYDGVYYAFDKANYPAAETKIINDKYSFK